MKIGIIVVLIALLTACGENKDKERTISVSILPQRYFVGRIAGDYVKVNVMIPPGANPAVSDLSTEQLKALHNSSVYFAVGYLPFELSNLYPFLETQKNMSGWIWSKELVIMTTDMDISTITVRMAGILILTCGCLPGMRR